MALPEVESKGFSELVKQYQEILKLNGISDSIATVDIKGSGAKDRNLGCKTEYVTVRFLNPDLQPLYLFTKLKTTKSQSLEDIQAFQKEATFYNGYLPLAKEFCNKLGLDELLEIYPKCYYADEKLLVLENLELGKGYQVIDKDEQDFDFNTAILPFQNIAKHHAVSYAVIQSQGGPESFFKKFPNLNLEVFMQPSAKTSITRSYNNGIDSCMKILKKIKTSGSLEAYQTLEKMKGNVYEEVIPTLKPPSVDKDCFLVLNHGDYWSRNMMFLKDEQTNEFKKQIMIDFQMTRYCAPCVDLGYLAFTSLKPEVRRTQLTQLLQIYLNVLKQIADSLGTPIDITLDDLKTEFCKNFFHGFWFCIRGTIKEASVAVSQQLKNMEITDMTQMMEIFDTLMEKWITENPGRFDQLAQNIIQYVKEYEMLKNGEIFSSQE